jgi:hypothetical protein
MKKSGVPVREVILLAIMAIVAIGRASARIRLSHALSDHAVLQRGVPIHTWG